MIQSVRLYEVPNVLEKGSVPTLGKCPSSTRITW
jgi:hypothetical protein